MQGVEDDAFDGADFLGVRGEAGEQGDEEDVKSFHNYCDTFVFDFREQKYRNMQEVVAAFRRTPRFLRRNPYRRALIAFVASS